ncbi:MAG: hypothetical protein ACXAC5_02915 [Promethearchaeota archaeon]|jgi:hypothetical protein
MTYFKENTTTKCGCGEQKTAKEIFCPDCANYWAYQVGKQSLPFKNFNVSVEWMNAMHNDFFGHMANALCP